MPRYMLDTDTCSYIMKRSIPTVLKRLEAVPVSDVCMSVVTKAELLYGVEVSPRALKTPPRWRRSSPTSRRWTSPTTPLSTTPRSAPI
jgi:predicted nucleic acid-binding protein